MKEKNAAAFTTGMTEAEIAGLAINLAHKGRESLLADIFSQIERDPSVLVFALAGADLMGHLIINGNIPWVSEYFKNEAGSVDALPNISIGIKFGMLVHDAFFVLEKHHNHEMSDAEKEEELDELFKEFFKLRAPLSEHEKYDFIEQASAYVEFEFKNMRDDQDSVQAALTQLEEIRGEQKSTPKEAGKEIVTKTALLRLEMESALLPHIHHTTKREQSETVESDEILHKSIYEKMNPTKARSFMGSLFSFLAGSVSSVFRCLFLPLHWNPRPLYDLYENTVLFGLHLISDIEEALAWVFSTAARISRSNTLQIATLYTRQALSNPIDQYRKKVTPNSTGIINRLMVDASNDIKTHMQPHWAEAAHKPAPRTPTKRTNPWGTSARHRSPGSAAAPETHLSSLGGSNRPPL